MIGAEKDVPDGVKTEPSVPIVVTPAPRAVRKLFAVTLARLDQDAIVPFGSTAPATMTSEPPASAKLIAKMLGSASP
jgi:hypothetical protein